MKPHTIPARVAGLNLRPMPEHRARHVLTVHAQTAALALILTATATAAAVLLITAYLTTPTP